MDEAELLERMRTRFAIQATEVEFLPVGNDSSAWSYRVSNGDDAWFVKLLAWPLDPASVDVPRYLVELGVGHLLAPVPTIEDATFGVGDPFSVIIYPFVDGRTGGDVGLTTAQRTELGRMLRQIHDTPAGAELEQAMRRERFVPRDLQAVRTMAQRVSSSTFDDAFHEALATHWRRNRRDIDHVIDRIEAIATKARARSLPVVICHADIHAWNVLIRPAGDLVVVDWDETLLAPRERDLMFVDGGVGGLDNLGPAFYEGYGQVEIDPVAIAYYRYDWVLQELADYWRRVSAPDVGDDTKTQAVDLFASLFEPGGVVEAALRADHVPGG